MPQPKRAKQPVVYQLKVSLKGVKPPIWRRLEVRDDEALAGLHHILQQAMSWSDDHMHEFTVAGISFGAYNPLGELSDSPMRTAPRRGEATPLAELNLKPRSVIKYEYDFGDDWELSILVEEILPVQADVTYPRCVAGQRAAPPEDSGGPWRYAQLVEVLSVPDHPDYAWAREWVGEEFDPAAFDLEKINRRLAGEYLPDWEPVEEWETEEEAEELEDEVAGAILDAEIIQQDELSDERARRAE